MKFLYTLMFNILLIPVLFGQENKYSVEEFLKELKSPYEFNRSSAAYMLHKNKETIVVNALIEVLLNDKSNDVRKEAANSLGDIGDRRAVEPLINSFPLEKNKCGVDGCIAKALGKIGDSKTVELLISKLNNDVCGLSEYCAEALGNIKDRRAVKPLINVLKNEFYHLSSKVSTLAL